jgi:transposase-like protein
MPRKKTVSNGNSRRRYTEYFKAESVQMMLDGYAPESVRDRLELPNANMLWV